MTTINLEGAENEFYASDNFFWLSAGEKQSIDVIVNWESEAEGQLKISAWNSNTTSIKL